MLRRWRYATATDDGLLVGRTVVPWSDVYHLDWTRGGAEVATRIGWVDVRREDAEVVEQHLAPWEAERDAAVAELSEADLMAWLGGAPLRMEQGRGHLTFGAVLCGVFWIAAVLGLASGIALLAVPLGAIALFYTIVVASQCEPPLKADARGLTLEHESPIRMAWSEVRGVVSMANVYEGQTDAGLVITTRCGPRTISRGYAGIAAVSEALQQCLAHRARAVLAGESRGIFAHGRRTRSGGLWLDDSVLYTIPPGRPLHVSWSELSPPRYTPQGPLLVVGRRRFRLWEGDGGRELARTIDQRLGGDTSLLDADGVLRAEVIERWLGVPAGGSLVCGLRARGVIGRLALVGAWLGLYLIAALHAKDRGSGLFWFVSQAAIGLGTVLVALVRTVRAVTVDAHGLSVRARRGRRESYAWSEIERVGTTGHGWEITTTRGPVVILKAARNVDRVIGIIRQMLAERDFGSALPTGAPLPETALSRMRGDGPTTTDRGLSLSEPIHPQP